MNVPTDNRIIRRAGLASAITALTLLVSAFWFIGAASAQDPTTTPTPTPATDDCRLVGHPDSARWSDPDEKGYHPSNAHRNVAGEKISDVVFRKGVPYEFTVVCNEDAPPSMIWFRYRTIDAPFSTTRDGFIRVKGLDDDIPPSLAVIGVWNGTKLNVTFSAGVCDDDGTGCRTSMRPQEVSLPYGSVAAIADSNVCKDVRDQLYGTPEGKSHHWPVDGDFNYRIRTNHWSTSGFRSGDEPSDWRVWVTYCSRGQGRISIWEEGAHARRSKEYRIQFSRFAVQLDSAPGGPVAAQILLTLLSGLIFWGTSGKLGPARPYIGLAGLMVGAMALPVMGYGSWFLAGLLFVIGVLFGYFYVALISGKT